MKKLIVALCTLALSLAGTFGAYQKSFNSNVRSNSSLNILNAAQYAKDADGKDSLSNDKKATAVNYNTVSSDTSANAETPKLINTVLKNSASAELTDADKQAAAVNTYGTSNSAQQAILTSSSCNTANQSAVAGKITANSNTGSNCNTANGQVVYKNVDLSGSQSVKDAVSQLQKNGCSNINPGNVKSIQSLKDILANIQKKGNCSNGVCSNISNSNCTNGICTTNNNCKNGTCTTNNNCTNGTCKTNNSCTNGTCNSTSTVKPAPTAAPAPTQKPAAPAPTQKPAAPTAAPKPSTSTGSTGNSSSVSSYAAQVLQLVNQERAKAGLSAYTTNSTLTAAANVRAKEIVQSFSHTRPNGSSFSSVLKEYGISYRTAGENIAYGQKTPQEVVTGWMNSPGHRANILNSNFNKIGIGVYQVNGVYYWSQEFTN